MKQEKDILQRQELKANPYTVPSNYFSNIEDSIREKIKADGKESIVWHKRFFQVTSSYFMLACSFGLIFGMAYGVLSLTSTLNNDNSITDTGELLSLVEQGYISSDFIEDYYDTIDFEEDIVAGLQEEINMSQITSSEIEYYIEDEDLIEYYNNF